MSDLSSILDDFVAGRIAKPTLCGDLAAGTIVIMASYSSPEDHSLTLQNFIHDGKPFIPLFSDVATAHRLLQGAQIPSGVNLIEISGPLLFELFQGQERLIINASGANAVEFHAHEVKPYVPVSGLHSIRVVSAQTRESILVVTEPTPMTIGMRSSPPSDEVLAQIQAALAHSGAREVYWFWMSLPGGEPHLGLAVSPGDADTKRRVGRAVEPIWMKYSPANSTIDVLPLDDAGMSDTIRVRGRVLYKAAAH